MSLTSTSRRPCSASMRATSAATCAGSRWSTATAIPSPPAAVDELGGLLDRLGPVDLGAPLARAAAGGVDRRARLAERDGDAAPGAARRARDQRDLALQRSLMPSSFRRSGPAIASRGRRRGAPRLQHEHGGEHERAAGELHGAQRLAEDEEREQHRHERLDRGEDRRGRRPDAPQAGEEEADRGDRRDDARGTASQPQPAAVSVARAQLAEQRPSRRSATPPRRCRRARTARAARRAPATPSLTRM